MVAGIPLVQIRVQHREVQRLAETPRTDELEHLHPGTVQDGGHHPTLVDEIEVQIAELLEILDTEGDVPHDHGIGVRVKTIAETSAALRTVKYRRFESGCMDGDDRK